MKLSAFALSATAAFVLSACGNGGTYQPTTAAQPTLKPSATPQTQTAGKSDTASGSPAANNQNGKQPDTSVTHTTTPSATGGNASGSLATNKPNTGKPTAGNQQPVTGSHANGGTTSSASGNPDKNNTGTNGSDHTPVTVVGSQPSEIVLDLPAGKIKPTVFSPVASSGVSGVQSTGGKDEDNNDNTMSLPEFSKGYLAPTGATSHDAIRDGNGKSSFTVNGIHVSLLPDEQGDRVKIGEIADGKSYGEVGKELKYAAYGWFDHHAGLPEHFEFVWGDATKIPDMPQKGVAEYRGKALFRNHLRGGASAVQGDAAFTVDFGGKKVNGSIAAATGKHIALEADITNNWFEGIHTAGTYTKGRFFGPKADELAGTFENLSDAENPYSGAFGAARQDK